MYTASSQKLPKPSPFEVYYKNMSPHQHFKTLSTGQSNDRSSTNLNNVKQNFQSQQLGSASNEKKLNCKLKNLQQKLQGVEHLLRKKGEQSRGQTITSRLNSEECSNIENDSMNIMNGSSYPKGFDGRTTCPNVYKKIEQNNQPALRTTSNLSHLTKYGLSSPENKSVNSSSKKTQLLESLKAKKSKIYEPKTPTLLPSKLDDFSASGDSSFDYYQSFAHTTKSFFRQNGHKNSWTSKPYTKQSSSNETQESSLSLVRSDSKFKNSLLGDFRIMRPLGKGKFGQVFLAQHKPTSSLYALKKISKAKVQQQKMINQFIEEVKLHSCLEHPNIVKFFGFFEQTDAIYLILEYINGKTLFDYLNEKQKIPLKEAVNYLRDTIEAVVYLHDRSIAHRDIKPENIILTLQGVAKICDFGWSALIHTSRKTYCGTFDYVPPQILERKNYDLSVDLWCIGILTYELLCGDVPFDGEERVVKMKKILSVDKTKIVFPEWFTEETKKFIDGLVRKEPSQRLRSRDLLKHQFFVKNPPAQIKKK